MSRGGAVADTRDLPGWARRHDAAALVTAARTEVDHPVGLRDDRAVVLDDHDRVPGVHEPLEKVPVIRLRMSEAVADVRAVLMAHGYASESASVLAENCVTAERDGSHSHGLFRLKDYLATVADGSVNGHAVPRVHDAGPGFVRVDADNGFAQVALQAARRLVTAKARANGIALVAVRNSHHLGALYLDVEPFADEDLVAMAFVNSGLFTAPPGGRKAVYGTNPMAFAAPRTSAPPLLFDQSSSTVAHGDLQVAARDGRTLPANTGIDSRGRPTGDPRAILDGGALSTFGGHKGASIALMVEVLCASLVGADFSHELTTQGVESSRTAHTGETLIVIDPGTGADGLPRLSDRVDDLVAALEDAGQERVPGDRRVRARREGGDAVDIDEARWAWIQQLLHDRTRRVTDRHDEPTP